MPPPVLVLDVGAPVSTTKVVPNDGAGVITEPAACGPSVFEAVAVAVAEKLSSFSSPAVIVTLTNGGGPNKSASSST